MELVEGENPRNFPATTTSAYGECHKNKIWVYLEGPVQVIIPEHRHKESHTCYTYLVIQKHPSSEWSREKYAALQEAMAEERHTVPESKMIVTFAM